MHFFSIILPIVLGLASSTLAVAIPGDGPGLNLPMCKACSPSPNNCDITAPCAKTFYPPTQAVVNYCACRAGYKATGVANNDNLKQWRVNAGGHPWEYRVYVAPGVECNTLCDDWTGNKPCSEVPFYEACPAYPQAFLA